MLYRKHAPPSIRIQGKLIPVVFQRDTRAYLGYLLWTDNHGWRTDTENLLNECVGKKEQPKVHKGGIQYERLLLRWEFWKASEAAARSKHVAVLDDGTFYWPDVDKAGDALLYIQMLLRMGPKYEEPAWMQDALLLGWAPPGLSTLPKKKKARTRNKRV